MKFLMGLCLGLFITGCGRSSEEQAAIDLSLLAQNGDTDALTEALSSSCKEAVIAKLTRTSKPGDLDFTTNNTNLADGGKLKTSATNDERCKEISNHLSGSLVRENDRVIATKLKVELFVHPSPEQDQQMADGKTIQIRPTKANIIYMDGAFSDDSQTIDLRCPDVISMTCQTKEVYDNIRCDSYIISYAKQSCTFRNPYLPFTFSDHKETNLNIVGDIELFPSGTAVVKINKMSWLSLH